MIMNAENSTVLRGSLRARRVAPSALTASRSGLRVRAEGSAATSARRRLRDDLPAYASDSNLAYPSDRLPVSPPI